MGKPLTATHKRKISIALKNKGMRAGSGNPRLDAIALRMYGTTVYRPEPKKRKKKRPVKVRSA